MKGGDFVNVERTVRNIIKSRGLRQVWVVDQMNLVNPDLTMSKAKLSSIVCGGRQMTADELVAFCVATKTDLNYFRDAGQDSA